jgi:hypothetical protein
MTTRTLDFTDYAPPGHPEWVVMGIFSTDDEADRDTGFCYTVGYGEYELHCPTASIEGRSAGPDMITMYLNLLGLALRDSVVGLGDDVAIPIGFIVDGEQVDAEAIFWISDVVDDPAGDAYECNMSPCSRVLPIRWSSPLGWRPEET